MWMASGSMVRGRVVLALLALMLIVHTLVLAKKHPNTHPNTPSKSRRTPAHRQGSRARSPRRVSVGGATGDASDEDDDPTAIDDAYTRLAKLGVIKSSSASLNMTRVLANARHTFDGAYMKASKLVREIKGSLSSDFERACLKATRPDDDPAKEKHVQALIASVAEFPDVLSKKFDPYRVMLHKLWSRMTERDWRTVAKSLYILHRLWQSITLNDNKQLQLRLQAMTRQHSRKRKSRYFSVRRLAAVRKDGDAYKSFLAAYASYLFDRISEFSGQFEELLLVGAGFEGVPSKALETKMNRARRVLKRVLEVQLNEDIANDVTAPCIELIAKDVGHLVMVFSSRLLELIEEGDSLKNDATSKDDLKRVSKEVDLCVFYCDVVPKLEEWVTRHARLCKRFGVRLSEQIFDASSLLPISRVRTHIDQLKSHLLSSPQL